MRTSQHTSKMSWRTGAAASRAIARSRRRVPRVSRRRPTFVRWREASTSSRFRRAALVKSRAASVGAAKHSSHACFQKKTDAGVACAMLSPALWEGNT